MVKYIFLVCGLLLLKALNDKYSIEHDTIKWHYSGFMLVAFVVCLSILFIMPLHLHTCAVLLLIGSLYWIAFDIVLNLLRGLKWYHIGNSKSELFFGRWIFLVKFVVLIISLFLCQHL